MSLISSREQKSYHRKSYCSFFSGKTPELKICDVFLDSASFRFSWLSTRVCFGSQIPARYRDKVSSPNRHVLAAVALRQALLLLLLLLQTRLINDLTATQRGQNKPNLKGGLCERARIRLSFGVT